MENQVLMFSDSLVKRIELIVEREKISEDKFLANFEFIVEIALAEEQQLVNRILSDQQLNNAVKKQIGYNVYTKLRAA